MSPETAAFLASWTWEPPVLLGLALAAGLYGAGFVRLRHRARGRARPPAWRALFYAAGLATVGLALLSPIAAFSSLFFFMHMAQHLLLVIVAAPLLWLGSPLLPSLWALPVGVRRAVGRLLGPATPLRRVFHALTNPFVAATLYVGSLAVWHVPAFYDAAQGRTATHDVEHLMFLGAALLYWWPIVQPTGGRRRLGYGAAVVYLFPAVLEGNLIGALLTFADRPLYATYQAVPRLWGISALQDQQIGGLLMWVLGGLLYLVPILALAFILLSQEDRAEERGSAAGRAPEPSPTEDAAHGR